MVALSKKPLFCLIGIKSIFLVLLALFFPLGLAPDEAQYWTWSKALDLGYFSKPAGISYQIAITTFLFGDNALGVRMGAILWGALITFLLYRLAMRMGFSNREAFWGAALFALSPVGFYLSFASTTDSPAICWVLFALFPLVTAVEGKNLNVVALGLAIAGGVFFKWSAFLFWPLYLIASIFASELRQKKIGIAFLISLVGFIPSLFWNLSHEFATFLHVKGNIFSSAGGKNGNFFDFFAAQIALFSPIPFLMMGFAIAKMKKIEKSLLFPFLFCFLLMIVLAFWKKMQPNWAFFFMAPLFLLAAKGMGCFKNSRQVLFFSLVLSSVTILSSLAILPLQEKGWITLSFRCNAFRQNAGNHKLGEMLARAGYSNKEFLFSDKYQNASLLSFYGPEKKRAYVFPLTKMRKNQFSFWPQMEEREKGASGYFLVLENKSEESLSWYETHYLKLLAPYFSQVTLRVAEPVFSVNNKGVRYALIFYCEEYLGGSFQQENIY